MVLERGRDPDPAAVHWGRHVKTQPSVRPLKTCIVEGGLEGVKLKTGRLSKKVFLGGPKTQPPGFPASPSPWTGFLGLLE